MITYVKGDATLPQGEGPKMLAHLCNDRGGWGKGFVLAVSARWSEPESTYRRQYKANGGIALGEIQVVDVEPNLWVVNMVAQSGYRSPTKGPPLRYPALERCLRKLAFEADARQASIHMPRIGCGLAGGNWATVETLIQITLGDRQVFVYDLDSQDS